MLVTSQLPIRTTTSFYSFLTCTCAHTLKNVPPPMVTRCFTSCRFLSLGSGSDYTMFQHNLGIASIDARYTYDTVSKLLLHFLKQTFLQKRRRFAIFFLFIFKQSFKCRFARWCSVLSIRPWRQCCILGSASGEFAPWAWAKVIGACLDLCSALNG